MKIFYWLIVIMNITLLLLLWLYIYNLYLQDHIPVYDYPSRVFQSDAAIPFILLGVILNTAAIVMLVRDSRRRRGEEESRRRNFIPPNQLQEIAEQDEIKDLEDHLEQIVERLEELRKHHGRE
jgi:type VI protein secretion system component VasK